MKVGRATLPTPPGRSPVVSVQRVTLHGLQLSISIIVSRLLVYRFDNGTACTVRCIGSSRPAVTSAEVTGLGGGVAAWSAPRSPPPRPTAWSSGGSAEAFQA